jgi:aspartate aminotransferase-like enzyme
VTETAPILFLCGPTETAPAVDEALALPLISHRGPEIQALIAECLPGMRHAFGTQGDVLPLSVSGSAVMEAALRNTIPAGGRVLHLVNGAFSRRWASISECCGLDHAVVEKPLGEAFCETDAAAAFQQHGRFDAVCVTHNETSSGALSDIGGVARATRAASPGCLVMVDAVSALAGVDMAFDDNGIDLALGSVAKCWALPPGLSMVAFSVRCRQAMRQVEDRGYHLDFPRNLEVLEKKGATLNTPAIPQLFALRAQIRQIEASPGGWAGRFERHIALRDQVLAWCAARGFGVLAEDGARSPSVTTVLGGDVDVPALLDGLKDRGFAVGGGYGDLKTTAWRIAHMGEHTEESVAELLNAIDSVLASAGAPA